jgi:hypothetical protein
MRSQRSILVLAVLAVASSTAYANHPIGHIGPGPTEPFVALAEMAADGYMVEIVRTGNKVFEVRVLHVQDFTTIGGVGVGAQYTFDRVDVTGGAPGSMRTCSTNATCSNQGLWLHGLRLNPASGEGNQLPHAGFYPAQTHEFLEDLGGRYLRVTITQDFDPDYNGAVNAVTPIKAGAGSDWVRGMYNTAKLVAPLDALDAVPQLVRIV